MRFYSKDINSINNFTTNGKIKSLILGLKDIDKVDKIVTDLSRISMIKHDSELINTLGNTGMFPPAWVIIRSLPFLRPSIPVGVING